MIGKNIAELRKRRGFTLSQLAERANMSKSYLSNIERDLNRNPSLEVMKKISAVLNVDLLTLLNTNNNEEPTYFLDREWIELINELQDSGMTKEQIPQYKTLIEFIKWQNKKL
ncbi:helix-turn-helix domain-containing protein [Peribacillus psychrosaccharolyticus]|uniref:helix-turn-helix domain-containing protein n=1 Tax=Peribacillus psychrosaccharolyticus TaxID=1407 RepID=UPI003D26688F